MIRAQDLFEDGYRPPELRLRICVIALIEVDPAEIAGDERDRQIVGAVEVLGQGTRPFEQRTRFRSLAAFAQSRRLCTQARDLIFRPIVGGCPSGLNQANRICAGCGVRHGRRYGQGVGASGVGDNLETLVARRRDLVLHQGNGMARRIGQLEADVDAALLHDHGGMLRGLEREAIRVPAVRGNLSFNGPAAFERYDVLAPGKERRRQRERDCKGSRHEKPPR